jgi:hypothetical protein
MDFLANENFPGNGKWGQKWGHPLKGPCQEEKVTLCEKIYFLAKLPY